MPLFSLKVKSFLGADTRIQVIKERSPSKFLHLDRNPENETKGSEGFSGDEKDSSSPPALRKGRRTQNRLTNHARATLQRIGGAISALTKPSDSLFLTGTFPGDSFEAQKAIASQASWILHRLKAWIYKCVGANTAYWVWEFQGRGTLHLHYVTVIPDPYLRNYIAFEFRNEWIRLIKGASARSGENLFLGRKGRDFFQEKELLQIYAQECYKSSSAYLSKYISKGKTSKFPPPTRLWGATREARLLVAQNLISLEKCSKSLPAASELAWQLDSYSNVSPEKRRFFRHRFSDGFTILVWDDTLRAALSTEKKALENKDLDLALDRLKEKINSCNAVHSLIAAPPSPALRLRFIRGNCRFEYTNSPRSLQSLEDDLKEIDNLIQLIPYLKYWQVSEIRNLIGAVICILKQ